MTGRIRKPVQLKPAFIGLLTALVAGAWPTAALAYTTAPNITVTTFVSDLCCFQPAVGPVGLAFDRNGNFFVDDYLTGTLYKFGPNGGSANDPGAQIGSGFNRPTGLAFSKDRNSLYLAEQGNGCCSDVLSIDPATGSVIQKIADVPDATGLAVDPVSGDVFASGAGSIWRISNVGPSGGTLSQYSTTGVDGIVFGSDGTMYGAGGGGVIFKFPPTNTQPATPLQGTPMFAVVKSDGTPAPIDGIGIGAGGSPGQPPFLYVNRNDGFITKVDFTTNPPTQTDLVSPDQLPADRGDLVTVNQQGCLFATQSTSIIKIADAKGSCNPPLTPPGGTTPKNVLFVHGINGDFRLIQNAIAGGNGANINWGPLVQPLAANSNLTIFPYYQDRGYSANDTANTNCNTLQPGPVTDPGSNLFLDPNSFPILGETDATLCDSESALALNAQSLDQFVQGGQTNILIANSMGGAITRGWLGYIEHKDPAGTSSQLATLRDVIFLQSANEGSYLAGVGQGVQGLFNTGSGSTFWAPLTEALEAAAANKVGFDPRRPGIVDLAPVSNWYRSVNGPPFPVNLSYFNILTSENLQVKQCVAFGCTPAATAISVGDTVVLPGQDSPAAAPPTGGSRFRPSPNAGYQRYEYQIDRNYIFTLSDVLGNPFGLPNLVAVTVPALINDPASHFNFGTNVNNAGAYTVQSCNSNQQITPVSMILQVVQGAC